MPTDESMHQQDDPEVMGRRLGRQDDGAETEAHMRKGGLRPDEQDDPEMPGRRLLQDDDEGPETEAHTRRG